MQLIDKLKELEIVFIPDYELGLNSYFIKRPYGNFLFFTHPKINHLDQYIEGSGGVYKVFEFHNVFKAQLKYLFNVYGSSLITAQLNYTFDQNFKQEVWPDEYYDIDLSLDAKNCTVEIFYKKNKILLVDDFAEEVKINEENYDLVLYRRIK